MKRAFIKRFPWLKRIVRAVDSTFRRESWSSFASVNGGDFQKVGFPSGEKWHCDYMADPFLLHHDDAFWLFYETTDRSKTGAWEGHGKGIIGCFKFIGKEWSHCGLVLEEDFHLSYPQVIEENGHVYMIPESSDHGNGCVYLYEAKNFPYQWEKVGKIIEKSFADVTILKKDGRWFAACYQGGEHPSAELWYSESLSGPWHRHPQFANISQSRRLSRCGGRFIVRNGKLYRVAQDCNGFYGKRLFLVPVEKIDSKNYVEGNAFLFCPNTEMGGMVHTYNESNAGNQVIRVFDMHTNRWLNPLAAIHSLYRRLFVGKIQYEY